MKRSLVSILLACSLALPVIAFGQPVSKKPFPKLVDVRISAEVAKSVEASKDKRTPAENKMSSSLLEVVAQYKANGNTFQHLNRPEPIPHGGLQMVSATRPKVDTLDRVFIYLRPVRGRTAMQLVPLVRRANGVVDIVNDKAGIVQAWVPVANLHSLLSSKIIANASLVIDPAHGSGPTTTEGDSRLRANVERATVGATGSGIKVGVMSDDCGSLEGMIAPRIVNGELGPGTTVLDDSKGGTRTHEGLAMMEIVQDVAPSSQLYFASASTGEANFAANILALAAAGCRVITDDVIYFDEPVFEDGSVAQAVNTVATANNVVYTSSSTNVGNANYFGTFNALAGQNVGSSGAKTVHNYGGGQFINTFSFPGGGTTLFFDLHWDDQYGASDNDYDLYLVDAANTTTIGSSTSVQAVNGVPNEVFGITNNGGTITAGLIVVRKTVSGTDPNPNARFKLAIFQGPTLNFNTGGASTWGHACATGALGCGAIGADRNSAIGGENNYNNIEFFSSVGPVYMVQFGAGLVGGNRPLLSTRTKPDVASFDGVTTSVPGFQPFYGTSAAAPHAAGVAALLLSMFPSLTSAQGRAAIEAGCIPYGTGVPNNTYGYGRTDAFRTLTLQNAAANPNTYHAAYASPASSIPDNSSGGVSSTVSLSTSCTNITPDSLYVSVTVDGHNKVGDLRYTLKSPDNTSITVMDRPVSGAGNATGKNPNIVLGDIGTLGAIQTANPAGLEEVGFYVPANLLSTSSGFRGHRLNGTWTLTVSDNAGGNTGILKDWGIYAKEGKPTDPQFTINWNPLFIFPNDHTLRNITVSDALSGGCSPSVVLQSIVSNEPDFTADPGDVAGDIQGATTGTNDLAFQLRSEDLSTGNGRFYTVTYRITDVGGYQRDTMFAIPAFATPGRVDPSTVVAAGTGSVTMDVAPSPNPLTTSSTISYTITGGPGAPVLLTIVNNRGKWVRNLDYSNRAPGTYTDTFDGNAADGTPLPNGVYAYQLAVGAPYNSLNTGIVIINRP